MICFFITQWLRTNVPSLVFGVRWAVSKCLLCFNVGKGLEQRLKCGYILSHDDYMTRKK
jgi:hypothetical protein